MAIVARTGRRFAAFALAAVLSGCSPAPSGSPVASAPGASPVAAGSPAACESVAVPGGVEPGGTPPAWADRVFYEVFVRSFADSDGDGVGDLAGLTSKLDYLNDGDAATTDDLGLTGIWLMPVAESASYHGYDVTDYTAVERDYGDRAALREFVEAAHERGILVIVDFVINHTSSQHPWFEDALAGGPHRDWYIWSDTNPVWPAVAGGNPWHRTEAGDYYYGAFWEGMPDLDLRNPEVTAEIERVAGVWLDELGVDGFRIDAAKHLIEVDAQHQINTPETMSWLADFAATVHAEHPDALIVSEVWDIARISSGYVPDSSDLTFDFGMATATVSALQTGRTPPIETALRETMESWPVNRAAAFLTNHDQNRLMSQLNGDLPSARLAAFMLLTGPGVPFLYYGEELGMQGRKPDERIRTPMQWTADGPGGGFSGAVPWQPLADDWQTVNVASQAANPASLLATYRDSIALRQANRALLEGGTVLVDGGSDPVVGWLRVSEGESLLVVVNVGAEPVTDYALSLDEGPLCGVSTVALVSSIGDAGPPEITAPVITSTGGLNEYRPIATLAPRSGYVIRLGGGAP
jgi:glycosidase